MDKEFVNFDQAVELNELKYDADYNYTYTIDKHLWYGDVKADGVSTLAAPLKQQVFRWFREKKLHNTFPSIIQTRNWATVYRILEWHPGNDSTSITTSDYYDTYEEAENACIDKLIELAKQQ